MALAAGNALRRKLLWAVNHTPEVVATKFATDARISRYARPILNRVVPDDPVPVSIRSGPLRGSTVVIRPRGEKFYWTGTYEPWVQEALARLIVAGSKIWDVGAHVGFFTLLASKLSGLEGEVHAFEPIDATRDRLQQVVSLNSCRNVQVHAVAIAPRGGSAFMREHEASSMSSLVQDYGATDVRVACETLEELAQRLGPPQLIKLDVEGAELAVLESSADFLKRCRPAVIVELTDPEMEVRFQTVVDEKLHPYIAEHLGGRHFLISAAAAE